MWQGQLWVGQGLQRASGDPKVRWGGGGTGPALPSCEQFQSILQFIQPRGERERRPHLADRQAWASPRGVARSLSTLSPSPVGSDCVQLCPVGVPVGALSSPPRGRKAGTTSQEGLQIPREWEFVCFFLKLSGCCF